MDCVKGVTTTLFENLTVNVLILIASFLILDKASHMVITNAVRVADITGFGKTTIGFILIGISTSLPELCTVIIAALFGEEYIGVALGNVLGSNVVNVCLILGSTLLLTQIKNKKTKELFPFIIREESGSLYFALFVSSIIPLSLTYIQYASQFVGFILILMFIFYMYQMYKEKVGGEEGSLGEQRQKLWRYTLLTLLGIGGVIASSYFMVDSASSIATQVGVPPIFVGGILVAFGTSLPELVTSLKAVSQGHPELAFGEIVGSCFINVTLILGAALVTSPISKVNMVLFMDLITFSVVANLSLWYFLSIERMRWKEGAVLLFIYALFLVKMFGGL